MLVLLKSSKRKERKALHVRSVTEVFMKKDYSYKAQKRNKFRDKFYDASLPWLWRVTGKYKGCVAVLLVLQIIFGVCGVVFAMLFRDLIDGAVAGDFRRFSKTAILLVALEFGELLLSVFARFMSEWTSSSLENRFKERLFSSLLHKDYAAVTALHSGEWLTRLTSDAGVVTNGVIGIFPGLAGMAARLTGALIALYYMEPAFFYVIIPAGILILLITSVFRGRLKRLHKKIQEANGAVVSFLQERLESLMIIRVFSMEKQTCEEAAKKMEQHKTARLKRNHFSNLCNTGFGLAMDGGYLFGAIYCGYGILKGTMSYGTFTAILQLVGQVQSRVAGISGIVPQYYAMLASAERLMESEAYEDDGNENPVDGTEISRFYREEFQGIGVREAAFSYRASGKGEAGMEETSVIENFNLYIPKGEYAAFTGHSGCGKSTLLKLLMCLYPLDKGERYLKTKKDGREAEIPLTASWRGLFAYVPQGNQLMSGTIREIVSFGDPEGMRQEERLREALKIACADEFVSALEKGIDTMLGERGCGLSEGQIQRIAIARAIFSDRPVLILDESTSSLDEMTEQKLLANLREMTDKTVLIITHRPAVLRICDREIVMAGKRIE